MRFFKMQTKEVVNVCDGKKIGYVSDIEICWSSKCIEAIIVEKMNIFRFFCFFKEPPCLIIPVECVLSFGGDVILVNIEM